jgi:class 3 adenylate cyclase
VSSDDPDQVLGKALEDAGLIEPGDPVASDRFEAFRLLVSRGATIENLAEYRDEMGLLATRLALLGLPTLTLRQLAERTGAPVELVERLWLAAGIPDVGVDVPTAVASDEALIETFVAGAAVYGEELALQLARVISASCARMADALVSVFVAIINPQVTETDSSGLSLVQANFAQTELFPMLMRAIDQVLRRHLVQVARPPTSVSTAGYESQTLVVGFIDLTGSTSLAKRLDFAELGAVLREFEATVSDTVVRHRCRVVKFIGDEVMFTGRSATSALGAAVELAELFRQHPRIPPVRAGLAFGPILTREGDYFGSVVNLAARMAAVAGPNSVLIDSTLRSQLSDPEWVIEDAGTPSLKGFDAPMPLFRVARHRSGADGAATQG